MFGVVVSCGGKEITGTSTMRSYENISELCSFSELLNRKNKNVSTV